MKDDRIMRMQRGLSSLVTARIVAALSLFVTGCTSAPQTDTSQDEAEVLRFLDWSETLDNKPSELPPSIRALTSTWTLDYQIANGGWASVFYNRRGNALVYAICGYRLIGADRHAEIAFRAFEVVSKAELSWPVEASVGKERWHSSKLMDLVGEDLESLDDEWQSVQEREDYLALLAASLRTMGLDRRP